jgi:diguanylate cyclase (GGDEF)-like protein
LTSGPGSAESRRLSELRSYDILDSLPEEEYDTLARLVATICGTPLALVSLIDESRQWFKSHVGLVASETSRESSFCACAIERPGEMLIVEDALADPRFADNPLVLEEPHIRFYAGVPLISRDGFTLGTLCVIDRVPRTLEPEQIEALKLAARCVMALLDQRRTTETLRRLRAEQRLAEDRLMLLESVAVSASEGVLIVDAPEDGGDATIAYANAAFARLNGVEPGDLIGRGVDALWATVADPACRDEARAAFEQGRAITLRCSPGIAGDERALEVQLSPVTSREHPDRIDHWIFLVRDISDRERAAAEELRAQTISLANEELQLEIQRRLRVESELSFAALHDALTKLPNRPYFIERLRRAIADADANGGRRFAVMFVDLDRFKHVNDTLGHMYGDALLVEVGRRLRHAVRTDDFVARLGGDEFTVLLHDASDRRDVVALVERLTRDLSVPYKLGEAEVFVSASVGIVFGEPSYTSPEDLLRDADIAMFHAKARGRDRYEFFHDELRERVVVEAELDKALRHALERGEFRLAYQPIVSLRDAGFIVEGFEALVRWNNPFQAAVGTLGIISAAESSGLIVPIGEWVFGEACRQLAIWQAEHRASGTIPIVSVNVSARQLATTHFADHVERTIGNFGVDPRFLALELTESALLHDVDVVAASLSRLRKLGLRIYLDDFGTGYSSLSYLRHFSADWLKIDRSFVSGNGPDLADEVIVDAIISLAHRLGIRTVAEGVETHAQLERLVAMGCESAQGFAFSPAIDVMAASALLRVTRRVPA